MENSPYIDFEEIQYRFRGNIPLRKIKKIIDTLNILKLFKPNIILLEGSGPYSIIAIFIKRGMKIPIAVRIKGDIWNEYNEIKMGIPIFNILKKIINYHTGILALRNADIILPISEKIKSSMEINFEATAKYNVVNLGQDNANLLKRKEKNKKRYVISITNFNFWGKILPLIEAIENVEDILSKYGITWYILGDGYFFNRFRERINKRTLNGTVELVGHTSPLPYLMGALANFYISGMDGLPNVLLESYNFGVPIVMNHDCPAVEFINDGKTGKIINFSDHKIVEEVIKSLINDYPSWQEIGDNGKEYAQRVFSTEKVSTDLYKALKSIT